MSIRYDSSSSVTILKNHRIKSKIRWYRWKEMCTDPHWQDCNLYYLKMDAASICVEVFWYTVKKTSFLSMYVDGMMMRVGLKNHLKLMYFCVKHFALKEITSVLNKMGCASRECKQNMKICVCDILSYDQKIMWKRKIWFTHHEMLLQYGRTERSGIFRRTHRSLMTLCSEKDNQGTMSNDTSHSLVPACSSGLHWKFDRTYLNPNITSRQIATILVKGSFTRPTWYDSSTYWTQKPPKSFQDTFHTRHGDLCLSHV